MTIRTVMAALVIAVLVVAGGLWLAAIPASESLSRPPISRTASAEARGAAAFAGAGFGGISTDALTSNAVP